jgi:hypothetical protein
MLTIFLIHSSVFHRLLLTFIPNYYIFTSIWRSTVFLDCQFTCHDHCRQLITILCPEIAASIARGRRPSRIQTETSLTEYAASWAVSQITCVLKYVSWNAYRDQTIVGYIIGHTCAFYSVQVFNVFYFDVLNNFFDFFVYFYVQILMCCVLWLVNEI